MRGCLGDRRWAVAGPSQPRCGGLARALVSVCVCVALRAALGPWAASPAYAHLASTSALPSPRHRHPPLAAGSSLPRRRCGARARCRRCGRAAGRGPTAARPPASSRASPSRSGCEGGKEGALSTSLVVRLLSGGRGGWWPGGGKCGGGVASGATLVVAATGLLVYM